MSHFTVLVIGEDVEEQLAPFQENNMGDCPKKYMEFNDMEDEMLKEYENDEYSSGELLKEKYSSFDVFAKEYHGYKQRDAEKGRYGYWENPNKKWDWWVVGGRWTGMLKAKANAIFELGEEGFMGRAAEEGWGDSMLKRDIDIEGIRDEQGEIAASKYDKAMAIIGDLPTNKPWEEIRDRENIDASRQEFWSQPRCVAWNEHKKAVGYENFPFGWDESPDSFLISREQYIENARRGAITTHAVIKDGKWYERGKMGWWAMVSDKKEDEQWDNEFSALIDSIPEDTRLTVVDCHI
jgi:hypothetical protein